MKVICFIISIMIAVTRIDAQCSSTITSFPYHEDFEITDGGWISGGTGNDWAWGSPSKSIITGAGSGLKSWVVGGLTGSSYTSSEASWLQSPCYDFSTIDYPYIEFKLFWETESRFDGASLQYSTDNGLRWTLVGSGADAKNCLNTNWFNFSPIVYIASLTSVREGWSGTIVPTSGSCEGGGGSNGWVTAKHTMPYLGGRPSVMFRFIFGAGTICNSFDGFGIDDLTISEAPATIADYSFTCGAANTVSFESTANLCPTGYQWNFGDPASGTNNSSALEDPSHVFSSPGSYVVTLTVSGPGNEPVVITHTVFIPTITTTILSRVDCISGTGGSAQVNVTGGGGPYNYSWNTVPIQTNAIATGLGVGDHTVTVSSANSCAVSKTITIPYDLGCIGIYFPAAFTPNKDGRNDQFGPLGSIASLSNYKLSVYNRWGELVFISNDPFKKWDGSFKGNNTDPNVFVWFAEFSLDGGSKQIRKGTIMLIR